MISTLKVCPVCGRKERWHQDNDCVCIQVEYECGAVYGWNEKNDSWEVERSEDSDNLMFYCPYATDVVTAIQKGAEATDEGLLIAVNEYHHYEIFTTWMDADFGLSSRLVGRGDTLYAALVDAQLLTKE